MRTRWLLLVGTLLPALASAATSAPSRALMTFLTSPEIGGREAGTPEAARVADTLAALMERAGLKPAASNGYFQSFVAEAPRLDSAHTYAHFYLEGEADESEPLEATLASGLFFFPRHGRTQTITAPIINGGYGIVAPELGREDYAPHIAHGKVLMLFLGAPPDSVFKRGGSGFRYSLSMVKARIARESGARALFLVQADGDSGRLRREIGARERDFDARMLQLPGTQTFPVFYLDTVQGDRLQHSCAASPGQLVASLSIAFTWEEPCTLRNIAGILPGSDPQMAPELILVGAHYDHLGRRGDTYYPGADDNASGVVALMAAAQTTAAGPPGRSVLFVFFDGEEKGLLGSKWLAEHPLGEGEIVAMINLDGVGRKASGHIPAGSPLKIDDSELTVFHSSQAAWIEEELGEVAAVESLNVAWDARPVFHEFSDHASFHAKEIPTLFFFSGFHADYHTPADTPDKIEWALLDRRAQFLAGCVEMLGNRKARPVFVREGAGEGP